MEAILKGERTSPKVKKKKKNKNFNYNENEEKANLKKWSKRS
jgi:hypothetical protein